MFNKVFSNGELRVGIDVGILFELAVGEWDKVRATKALMLSERVRVDVRLCFGIWHVNPIGHPRSVVTRRGSELGRHFLFPLQIG